MSDSQCGCVCFPNRKNGEIIAAQVLSIVAWAILLLPSFEEFFTFMVWIASLILTIFYQVLWCVSIPKNLHWLFIVPALVISGWNFYSAIYFTRLFFCGEITVMFWVPAFLWLISAILQLGFVFKKSKTEEQNIDNEGNGATGGGVRLELPLAVAQVYNLSVVGLTDKSKKLFPQSGSSDNQPLRNDEFASVSIKIPSTPSKKQLRADVLVELPVNGGRIKRIRRKGRKTVYMERNRHGEPKRILWVDRQGRVFAESADYGDGDDVEDSGSNSMEAVAVAGVPAGEDV